MKLAIFLFFTFLFAGFVLLCAGVYVLAGFGWALIAAAVSMLSLAVLSSSAIRRLSSKGFGR